MPSTELAVGERVRRQAGLAIVTSLVLAAIFCAVTLLGKETPALYVRLPWQDDPYDAVVSLDFIILPILVTVGGLRLQLCRRYAPLPARRLVDLLRISSVTVGVCLATQLSDWVAVGLGLHSTAWTAVTAWQVAALAVMTAATIATCLLLRRAAHAVSRVAGVSAQPDWLTDAVTLGLRVSRALGRHRDRAQKAVRQADKHIFARVRRHPIAAAAGLAAVLALPNTAAKVVLEGYSPALVLLSFALPTAGVFAFVVLSGRYLRIVAPPQGRQPAWVSATVVGCAAGTVAFAFHDSVLPHQTAATLNALFFGGGVAAGVLSLTTQTALRRLRTHNTPADRP